MGLMNQKMEKGYWLRWQRIKREKRVAHIRRVANGR